MLYAAAKCSKHKTSNYIPIDVKLDRTTGERWTNETPEGVEEIRFGEGLAPRQPPKGLQVELFGEFWCNLSSEERINELCMFQI